MSLAPTQTSPPGSRTENLAGVVERVTFHNEENGFCVLRLKARGQRDLITAVGHAAMISAGEWVQAAGTWTNDRTHGLQFRAAFLKVTPPTTLDGIERYLGSGMIRGIGPAYAKRLVKAFAEAVFDVIACFHELRYQGRRGRERHGEPLLASRQSEGAYSRDTMSWPPGGRPERTRPPPSISRTGLRGGCDLHGRSRLMDG